MCVCCRIVRVHAASHKWFSHLFQFIADMWEFGSFGGNRLLLLLLWIVNVLAKVFGHDNDGAAIRILLPIVHGNAITKSQVLQNFTA